MPDKEQNLGRNTEGEDQPLISTPASKGSERFNWRHALLIGGGIALMYIAAGELTISLRNNFPLLIPSTEEAINFQRMTYPIITTGVFLSAGFNRRIEALFSRLFRG